MGELIARLRPSPGGRAGSSEIIAVIVVMLQVLQVAPLSADNIGREFVFSFPPNHQQGNPANVGVGVGVILTTTTTSETTNVDIRVPLKGYATRVILDASNSPLHVEMPEDITAKGISGISTSTLLIRADRDISVTAYNVKEYTMDIFSALPTKHLGAEYYVATYTLPDDGIIQISALGAPTMVEVHLNEAIVFLGIQYHRGGTIRYLLNRFETIQLETNLVNIVGTRIIANRSIAVTVGCSCAYVPPEYHRCDHLAEQLIPFNRWGRAYILSPLADRLSGYQFQIVAGRDDTLVMIGDVVITLHSREYYTGDVDGQRMTSIQSNKPIMIMQYSKGTSTDNKYGDPAMTLVTPLEAYTSRVNFPVYNFSAVGISGVFLAVTAECNVTNRIFLNHSRYDMITWRETYNITTQNNRHYCTRWMNADGGSHILTSEAVNGQTMNEEVAVFSSLVYGTGTRIAYLFNPGFNLEKLTCITSTSNTTSPATDVEVPCASLRPQTCPREQTNSLYGLIVWVEARPGDEVWSNVLCLFNTMQAGLPVGKRTCLFNRQIGAHWSAITFIDCGERRAEISSGELAKVEVDASNVGPVSEALEEVTVKLDDVDDAAVSSIAETLEHIIAAGSPSLEVTTSVVNAVNNLISSLDASEASDSPELAASSSSVVRSLEEQVSLALQESGEFTLQGTNMDVQAVTIDANAMHAGIEFVGGNTSGASIQLPASIFETVPNATGNIDSRKQVRFILFHSDALFRSAADNQTSGEVISAAVEGATVTELAEPVLISYNMVEEGNDTAGNQTIKCVYWDFTLKSGVGDWSDTGCQLVDAGEGVVTCACNHLTNFAVLIDYSGQHSKEQTKFHFALDVLSKVGCIVSIIGLVITIIIFLAFRRLRSSRPRRILLNFCVSLLCLYIVFLFGLDHGAGCDRACVAVGVLLHYFLLTTMTWMSVEALNMYVMIVRVFEEEGRHFLKKACVVAWGLPIIVVGVTAGVKTEDYLNKSYCFLTPGLTFFLAVLLPIAIILSFNFIVFVVVVRRLWAANLGGNVPIEKEDRAAHYKQIRTRLLNAFSISVLLGLTWVFGFLAIEGAKLVFQLLFCLANSFQGLVVFILFCLRQEDVRKSLKPHYQRLTSLLPQAGRPSTVTTYSLTCRSRSDKHERIDEASRCPLRTAPVSDATGSSRLSSDAVRLTSMSHSEYEDDVARYRMTSASDGDFDYRNVRE